MYVNLSGADRPVLHLHDANLVGVSFRDATLRDANFSYIDLSNADLEGAELQRARF